MWRGAVWNSRDEYLIVESHFPGHQIPVLWVGGSVRLPTKGCRYLTTTVRLMYLRRNGLVRSCAVKMKVDKRKSQRSLLPFHLMPLIPMPYAIMQSCSKTPAATVCTIFMFVLASWLWAVLKSYSCKYLKKRKHIKWSILARSSLLSLSIYIKALSQAKSQTCTLIPLSMVGSYEPCFLCSMTAVKQWALKAKLHQVQLRSVSILPVGHNISYLINVSSWLNVQPLNGSGNTGKGDNALLFVYPWSAAYQKLQEQILK